MRIVMLCLCGVPTTEESTIIDVKKVLEDYTWFMFRSTMGACAKTFLRRRDFIIDVPLNYYHTEDVNQVFVKREPRSLGPGRKKEEQISELRTEFRNNTNTNQTYKFRFERTRKASVNVTFQKGFTLGGNAHFTLGLPATGKAGGGLNMSLQVTKTDGENFEDTLVLEATSDIAVEKKHTYTTGVSLQQIDIAYDFTVETILRMPNNKAPVTIKKRRGGDVVASFSIKNLKDVFENIPNTEIIEEMLSGSKFKQYAVKFVTSGIVEGAQLANQKIILDSQNIDSEDRSTSTMDIPQIVVRPSDLGTPVIPDHVPQPSVEEASTSIASSDKRKDLQTATERRSSFKRFNQFGENYTSLTTGSPETKILQTPKIPMIIRTSPSTPRASPTIAGINEVTVLKDQSLMPQKVGVRTKSPFRATSSASFQGNATPGARPKLSKMTSV